MEFSADISAEIVSQSNEEGILINAVKPNAIRFMPPLTVTKSEIDQAIIKIKNAIEKAIR
jgi:acetylornithine/succinyldiaminopimelate/putrescine aminotransferase